MNKRNILSIMIAAVVFCLMQILLSYLSDETISWVYVIASTIFFVIFEFCYQSYKDKKNKK